MFIHVQIIQGASLLILFCLMPAQAYYEIAIIWSSILCSHSYISREQFLDHECSSPFTRLPVRTGLGPTLGILMFFL